VSFVTFVGHKPIGVELRPRSHCPWRRRGIHPSGRSSSGCDDIQSLWHPSDTSTSTEAAQHPRLHWCPYFSFLFFFKGCLLKSS